MVFLVPDFWDCQRSIQAKYREEEAAARGERDARKSHGQHMEVLWNIYILYHIEHTHTLYIYIYIVYNSIYIYIHIFFKHIHIIDVDYRDMALRYVTLNCEKKGDMAVTQTIQMWQRDHWWHHESGNLPHRCSFPIGWLISVNNIDRGVWLIEGFTKRTSNPSIKW